MMSNNSMLQIKDLGTRYGGDSWALRDITIDITEGSTLAVLGPSGCGKSTLLRLVAGTVTPETGVIRLGDRTVSRPNDVVRPEERGVGMVFQDYALWPHMNVRQTIGYGLRYGRNKTDERTRDERVEELVDLLQLHGLEERRPSMLSGGQQQRVSIARALATRPNLLLFDEPLSNLDVQLRQEMRDELQRLFRSIDTTILYVTHDVSEALALADEVLVLHDGERVQLAEPAELVADPASGWVANIAGFISRLRLDSLDRNERGEDVGRIGSHTFKGRICGVNENGTKEPGDPVAFIHPDSIQIVADHGDLVGEILTSAFEGQRYRLRIRIEDDQQVIAYSREHHGIGEKVQLGIEPEGVVFFGASSK